MVIVRFEKIVLYRFTSKPMRKFNINSLILLAGGIMLLPSCPSSPRCDEFTETMYLFRLPIEIAAGSQIALGDTITVTSDFEDYVYDETAMRTYHLPDYEFYPFITLTRIDTAPRLDGFLNYAQIVSVDAEWNDSSTHSDGSSSLLLRFYYENNRYHFQVKFIIFKSGTYLLLSNSLAGVLEPHQSFPEKCRDRLADPFFAMNFPERDNNFELLLSSPDALIQSYTPDGFNAAGGFAFEVR